MQLCAPILTQHNDLPCCLTLQLVALNWRIEMRAELDKGSAATRASFKIALFELYIQAPYKHNSPHVIKTLAVTTISSFLLNFSF